MLSQGLANLFSKTSQYFKLCGQHNFYCDYSVLMQKDEEEYYFQRFGEQITQPRNFISYFVVCMKTKGYEYGGWFAHGLEMKTRNQSFDSVH